MSRRRGAATDHWDANAEVHWFSTRDDVASGDSVCCQELGSATGFQWVEARNTVKHTCTAQPPATKNDPAHMSIVLRLRNPYVIGRARLGWEWDTYHRESQQLCFGHTHFPSWLVCWLCDVGKSFYLSGPQFSHLYNGKKSSTYLIGGSWSIKVKQSEWCLTQNKCSIHFSHDYWRGDCALFFVHPQHWEQGWTQ